jgi:hypothetical protein
VKCAKQVQAQWLVGSRRSAINESSCFATSHTFALAAPSARLALTPLSVTPGSHFLQVSAPHSSINHWPSLASVSGARDSIPALKEQNIGKSIAITHGGEWNDRSLYKALGMLQGRGTGQEGQGQLSGGGHAEELRKS